MSNRFCIILNEGNQLLSFSSQPEDKIYKLKQGHLFIGGDTPYSTFTINNESWHIIGHIENLPLLNYLLFSYYPSHHDLINKEIICLAVKRYGMKIIELLRGHFCIIYEDSEGNLTLVTEGDAHYHQPAATKGGGAAYSASPAKQDLPAIRASGTKPKFTAACQEPAAYRAFISEQLIDKTDWQYIQDAEINQYRISLTRWQDHHLQFIQSFRWSPITRVHELTKKETAPLNNGKERYSLS